MIEIIDYSARSSFGHHKKWLLMLLSNLNNHEVRVTAELGNVSLPTKSAARDRWYQMAVTGISESAENIVFTSGDDALIAVLRKWVVLRANTARKHFLMFRLSPQPGLFGLPKYIAKVILIRFIKLLIPNCIFYELVLTKSKSARLLKTEIIVDSSFQEASQPIGEANARETIGLAELDGDILLVAGVLNSGKSIELTLRAWNAGLFSESWLLFAGRPDIETRQLIEREQLKPNSRILTLFEKLDDWHFDRAIEASTNVLALYRYSASSGVLSRALVYRKKVILGGSRYLKRQLRGINGVTVLDHLSLMGIKKAKVRSVTLANRIENIFENVDALDVYPQPILLNLWNPGTKRNSPSKKLSH